MARVSLLSNEQAPPEIREMFQKIEANGFRVINLYRVMAHCPKVGRYFLRLGNSILFKGAVPPNLRELAILRVGHINQAHYEYSHHVPIALRMGVRQEQIDALPDWEDLQTFQRAGTGPPALYRRGDEEYPGEGRDLRRCSQVSE